MKHLTVIYNGTPLFDGEIAELIWSDTEKGVKVEGRITASRGGSAGGGAAGGFLDMLTGLSKARTSDVVAEKRAEYEAEKAAETESVEA